MEEQPFFHVFAVCRISRRLAGSDGDQHQKLFGRGMQEPVFYKGSFTSSLG
jgi:hypothetical protein